MMELIEELKRRYKTLLQEQQYVLSEWKDITRYIAHHRGHYIDMGEEPNEGSDLSYIYDGTAVRALKILAAGMHGGLTSPTRPWFRLGLEDQDLMKYGPVRDWLDHVEKLMYGAFRRSNFYNQVHTAYHVLGAFATCALFEEEDETADIRFRCWTAGQYVIATNERGMVDTVFRLFHKSVENIVNEFDSYSEAVKAAIKNKQVDKYFRILHALRPNTKRDGTRIDSKNKKFHSIYVEWDDDKTVNREMGYDEFPVFVARWDVVGSDKYGLGPGHDVLPDVKMIQDMELSSLKALHKTVDPPMMIDKDFKDRLSLMPGAENYVDMSKTSPIAPLFEIKFNVNDVEQKVQQKRMMVKEGFFNDLFLMMIENPYGSPPTATEVVERHEEKLLMLGPVIERQTDELLDPCIDRTFNILVRKKKIPPAPPEIQDMEFKVEYISLLAQAQKMVNLQGINTTIDFAIRSAQAFPEVLDRINIDEALDAVADSAGSPPRVIRSMDKTLELRKAKAEEAKAAQNKQDMLQATEAARNLGGAASGLQGSVIDGEAMTALSEAIQ